LHDPRLFISFREERKKEREKERKKERKRERENLIDVASRGEQGEGKIL